jgi:hypothetical protein
MWTYCGKVIRVGRGWVDNEGTQHPAQWYRWSDDEKAAKGLVWDESLQPVPFDNRFYWSAGVPKSLVDVDAVDEDGNPVLDENGEQIVTKGLKSQAISTVKAQAAGLLSQTDWYVTRKAETDAAIPADVLTYREAVRTASGAIESAIEACDTLEAFMALYDAPVDAEGNVTGNAPINDWPDSL